MNIVLLIFYILLAIICGVFIVGIFYPKDNKLINTSCIILSSIVSAFIGIITFSIMPSNNFVSKLIYILLTILPFVPIGLFFSKIIKYHILKLIVACILILNFTISFLDIFGGNNNSIQKEKQIENQAEIQNNTENK